MPQVHSVEQAADAIAVADGGVVVPCVTQSLPALLHGLGPAPMDGTATVAAALNQMLYYRFAFESGCASMLQSSHAHHQ